MLKILKSVTILLWKNIQKIKGNCEGNLQKLGDIVEDYVDSDLETDKENRKSVSGWLFFVNGSSLIWSSRVNGQ